MTHFILVSMFSLFNTACSSHQQSFKFFFCFTNIKYRKTIARKIQTELNQSNGSPREEAPQALFVKHWLLKGKNMAVIPAILCLAVCVCDVMTRPATLAGGYVSSWAYPLLLSNGKELHPVEYVFKAKTKTKNTAIMLVERPQETCKWKRLHISFLQC